MFTGVLLCGLRQLWRTGWARRSSRQGWQSLVILPVWPLADKKPGRPLRRHSLRAAVRAHTVMVCWGIVS